MYIRGRRRGPYERAQLEEMWNGGQIPADTLYWHDDMAQWAVIADLFANTTIASPLPLDVSDADSMRFPAAS